MKITIFLIAFCNSLFIAAPATASTVALRVPPQMPAVKPGVLVRQRPEVAVQAGENTHVPGYEDVKSLPLGVPFEFETPLFKGKVLLRFRSIRSDDEESHEKYFEGSKRLMQTVVQGQFKKPTKMSEIYVGSIFSKPFVQKPSAFISKVMDKAMRRVTPGVIMDLNSDKPKIISLYMNTAQTVSIDKPGEEPDIKSHDLKENVSAYLGSQFSSPEKRKKKLKSPKGASQYEFDTDHIYTFHTYDEAVDYGTGKIQVPMYGSYDLRQVVGPQPLSLSAVTSQGEVLYSFEVWHNEHN